MSAHCSGREPGVNGSLSDALLLPVFLSFSSIPWWRLRLYVVGVFVCLFVCWLILHVKCFGWREIFRIVSGAIIALTSWQSALLASLCLVGLTPALSAPSTQLWPSWPKALPVTPDLALEVSRTTKHGPWRTIEFTSAITKLEYMRFKLHTNHSFLPLLSLTPSVMKVQVSHDILLFLSMCRGQPLQRNVWKWL